MKKIVVVTGPELVVMDTYQYVSSKGFKWDLSSILIPEASMGARACRDIVKKKASEMGEDDTLLVVTRHEFPLYGAIEAIEEKIVPREGVEIHLIREGGALITVHGLDDDMKLDNEWPFGILWG
jgi:hypothetical protein